MDATLNPVTTEATICGILVHSQPDGMDQVRQRLMALPGVEIHGNSKDGRLVVTVEDEQRQSAGDTVMQIQNMKGVISASVIYHFSGEIEDTNQEVSQ